MNVLIFKSTSKINLLVKEFLYLLFIFIQEVTTLSLLYYELRYALCARSLQIPAKG